MTIQLLDYKQPKDLKIFQININGIRYKMTEHTHLIATTKLEIVTIQETKLNPKLKTPDMPDFSIIQKVRTTD